MAAFTDEMHINSPSTTVFDLMADIRNELRWNGNISRAELTSGEPIGVGSQFIVEDKRGEHETTITVFDRPERIEFAMSSKQMDVAFNYTFTETDGTTTAVGTFDAQPKGFMKLLLPLLMPMIKREIARGGRQLQDVLRDSDRVSRDRALANGELDSVPRTPNRATSSGRGAPEVRIPCEKMLAQEPALCASPDPRDGSRSVLLGPRER